MRARTKLEDFFAACLNPLYFRFLSRSSQSTSLPGLTLTGNPVEDPASYEGALLLDEELEDVVRSLQEAHALRFLRETDLGRLQEIALHLWRRYYRRSHAPEWLAECSELLDPSTTLKRLLQLHNDRLAFLHLLLFEMQVQGVPSAEGLIQLSRGTVTHARELLHAIQDGDWVRFERGLPRAPFRIRVEHLQQVEEACS